MSKVYINTSVIIALVDVKDPKHGVVLRALNRLRRLGYKLITSNVLLEEPLRNPGKVLKVLGRHSVKVVSVDLKHYYIVTEKERSKLRLSESRFYDLMHVIVAKDLGVDIFLTADRKQRGIAVRKGLLVCHPVEVVEGRCP